MHFLKILEGNKYLKKLPSMQRVNSYLVMREYVVLTEKTIVRFVISGNADFQSAVPQISQLLENLHSTKTHLNQLWTVKRSRLEQCLQLKILEEDVEKVGNSWIDAL